MKRTGPRGSEWQVIGWEQAYKEIARKMTAIKAQHGPQGSYSLQIRFAFRSFISSWQRRLDRQTAYACVDMYPAGKSIAAKVMMGGDLAYGYRQYPLYGLFWPTISMKVLRLPKRMN